MVRDERLKQRRRPPPPLPPRRHPTAPHPGPLTSLPCPKQPLCTPEGGTRHVKSVRRAHCEPCSRRRLPGRWQDAQSNVGRSGSNACKRDGLGEAPAGRGREESRARAIACLASVIGRSPAASTLELLHSAPNRPFQRCSGLKGWLGEMAGRGRGAVLPAWMQGAQAMVAAPGGEEGAGPQTLPRCRTLQAL